MSKEVKRIVYASSTMGENAFNSLFKNSKYIPGQQAQKYNRLLQQGISKNGVEIIAISTPPINKKNIKKCFVNVVNSNEKGVFYSYTPVINVQLIRNVCYVIFSFFKGLRFLTRKQSAVVCDVLNISTSIGVMVAAKFLKKPIIGIVTDIPELMVTGHSPKQIKMCHTIIDNCTGYIFLTEAMNKRINGLNKPYIIIEGISDFNNDDGSIVYKDSKRKCMYAGLLDAEYGVKNLVEGFLMAQLPNTELHIFGSGPYLSELDNIIKENINIVYHGVKLNSEVVEMEKKCVLLINPRPSSGEFTMFSFPSKIMEYMSSGTATLATRLPGIPDEYYNYLLVIDDESPKGISEALRYALSKSDNELKNLGILAQKWVGNNKSLVHQGESLIKFVDQIT